VKHIRPLSLLSALGSILLCIPGRVEPLDYYYGIRLCVTFDAKFWDVIFQAKEISYLLCYIKLNTDIYTWEKLSRVTNKPLNLIVIIANTCNNIMENEYCFPLAADCRYCFKYSLQKITNQLKWFKLKSLFRNEWLISKLKTYS
jgi:hypothetical protein